MLFQERAEDQLSHKITGRQGPGGAAQRTVVPSVIHGIERYANNRPEVSHEAILPILCGPA